METSPAGRPVTAQQVLADWVGAVIAGDYTRACTDMADTTASPAQPLTAAVCASGDAKVRSMEPVLKGLRTAFAPESPANQADVQVASPAPTGDSTTIAADKITIGGQRLDEIVLARSTGVKPGDTNFTFDLTKIEGGWYLTDFNLDF